MSAHESSSRMDRAQADTHPPSSGHRSARSNSPAPTNGQPKDDSTRTSAFRELDSNGALDSSGAIVVDSPALPDHVLDDLATAEASDSFEVSEVKSDGSSDKTIASPGTPSPQGAYPRTAAHRDLADKLIGQTLEHFELEEFLGGGGMGVVFRAHDTRLKRTVALKLLSPDAASQPEVLQRFRVEAESAARLDHEGIARVFYVGEDRGYNFMAFEYVAGDNLRDLVDREGILTWEAALDLTFQIAKALEHASNRGVVHRDIKPSNVLVTPAGRAKLVDMGLARLGQLGPGEDLTNSGATLGTFDYISPEQAHDPRHADVRSDIYSLGCTLYFMLSGQPPFPDGTMLQKLLRHQGAEPQDIREINPDVPDELAHVLRRMLAKNPRSRQQSARELLIDVTAASDVLGLSLSDSTTDYRVVEPLWMSLTRQHAHWLIPVLALGFCVVLLDVFWSQARSASDLAPYSPLDAQQAFRQQPRQHEFNNDTARNGAARNDAQQDDTSQSSSPDGSTAAEQGAGRERPSVPVTGDAAANQTPTDSGANAGGQANSAGATGDHSSNSSQGGDIPRRDAPRNGNRPQGNGVLANASGVSPGNDAGDHEVSPVDGNGLPQQSTSPFGPDFGNNLANVSLPNSTSRGDLPPGEILLPLAHMPLAVGQNGNRGSHPGEAVVRAPRSGPRRLVVDPLADGTDELEFRTFKSALESARSGDHIELNFTGRLTENRPIRLPDANFSIRAGAGHRPVIVFRPEEPVSTRSMMLVRGSRLQIYDLAFELDLSENQSAGGLSMFEIGEGSLSFDGCWLTVVNAQTHRFADREMGTKNADVRFISVRRPNVPGAAPPSPRNANDPMNISPATQIELVNCVARGEGTFVASDGMATNVIWRNGILAISDYLLSGAIGESELVSPLYSLDVRHLTARLGGGLAKITNELGNVPAGTVLSAGCEDSILIGETKSTLLSQSGPQKVAMQQAKVDWLGSGVFYENFGNYWQVVDTNDLWNPTVLDEVSWIDAWPLSTAPMNGGSAYFANPMNQQAFYHEHSLAAYVLDEVNYNAARQSGSDGLDAGAIIQSLPDPPSEKFAPRGIADSSHRRSREPVTARPEF